MWTVLKAVALRFAIGRTLGGMLATLFLLMVPIAGVLKVVGLPTVVIYDSNGQERKRFNEFVPPERFLSALEGID